jgi:hypothetical protein
MRTLQLELILRFPTLAQLLLPDRSIKVHTCLISIPFIYRSVTKVSADIV